MIHSWISKLLRDAAFTCQQRELSCSGFCYLNSHCIKKQVLLNVWVPWEMNALVRSDTLWQLFLMVSGYHVGANSDGQQHGFSIQSSINLFPRISSIWTIALAWILEYVCIFTSFHFPDPGLYLLNGFDFYFWRRDSENLKPFGLIRKFRKRSFPTVLTSVFNIFPALFFDGSLPLCQSSPWLINK